MSEKNSAQYTIRCSEEDLIRIERALQGHREECRRGIDEYPEQKERVAGNELLERAADVILNGCTHEVEACDRMIAVLRDNYPDVFSAVDADLAERAAVVERLQEESRNLVLDQVLSQLLKPEGPIQ